MNALLRKDLPWVFFFLLGGTFGMVVALCSSSFVHAFVVTPGHREELFHVAWSCGLGLGVVAGCFDEVLGVREFLACRPVSAGAVLRARLTGCALVLAGWFVLVPAVAYLVMALVDPAWEPGWFRQLPSIWGAMLPAVSMCAVGLCAVGLPFAWWARLLCLVPLVVIPFTIIFGYERQWERSGTGYITGPGTTSWPAFVGGHLALCVLTVGWAWLLRGLTRDRERPMGTLTRGRAVAPVLGIAAVVAVIVLRLLADNAVDRLHAWWPHLVLHDGKPLLAVRPDWNEPWLVVDAEHRPTGERLASVERSFDGAIGTGSTTLRVEAPRDRVWAGWAGSVGGTGGSLLIDADGTAFWRRGSGFRQLAKTPATPRFGAKAWIDTLAVPGARAIVVGEPGEDAVWTLDLAAEAFVRVPLADGDRVLDGLTPYETRAEPLPDAAVVPFKDESLVHGERFGYVLREQRLLKVARVVPAAADDEDYWSAVRILDVTALGSTIEYDRPGLEPFRHRFEPRTAAECTFAGLALLLSAFRPPLLQAASGAASVLPLRWGRGIDPADAPQRARWFGPAYELLDPLVVVGGRWWLVAASFAVALLATWATRRRLRHRSADAATIRFWTIAVLLLGPVAAWLAIACERPRAWADRTVRIPPPAPRIASPVVSSEVVA